MVGTGCGGQWRSGHGACAERGQLRLVWSVGRLRGWRLRGRLCDVGGILTAARTVALQHTRANH